MNRYAKWHWLTSAPQQVNIDLNTHDRHSRSRLALESIENEKLKSWETILHYWPDQPRYDHLHIIVKGLVPGEWEYISMAERY